MFRVTQARGALRRSRGLGRLKTSGMVESRRWCWRLVGGSDGELVVDGSRRVREWPPPAGQVIYVLGLAWRLTGMSAADDEGASSATYRSSPSRSQACHRQTSGAQSIECRALWNRDRGCRGERCKTSIEDGGKGRSETLSSRRRPEAARRRRWRRPPKANRSRPQTLTLPIWERMTASTRTSNAQETLRAGLHRLL